MRYEDFRREYTASGLHREMLRDCPFDQFELWFEQATRSDLVDPTAMVLATVDAAGAPWQRIVLLKGLSTQGFVFYTNYDSDKARAIAAHPRVALHFPWNALERQVVVAGIAVRVPRAETEAYFASRPRESQIAAWASRQSRSIAGRQELEARRDEVRARFGDASPPAPDFWGGFRVQPERVEFWQGGEHRLHDRFVYSPAGDGNWDICRLQP